MKKTPPYFSGRYLSLRCFLVATLAGLPSVPEGLAGAPEQTAFLDNGVVRIGIDLSAGGSIFHFGPSATEANLLNHYDKGRFIQQSYYGRPDGSKWVEKPWRWNPVQGGGYRDEPAEVLEKDLSQTHLRLVSIPRHWATGEPVNEARMAALIRLEGPVAHIRFGFQYRGDVEHPPQHQELPAVFVDAAYTNLVRYEGNQPWSDGEVTTNVPGWPNQSATATEHWAAYVNDQGHGLGVFFPGTSQLTTYRFHGDGKQGPTGSACSYFAPIRTFAITPGLDFRYDVYLTLGTIGEIRARFAKIKSTTEATQ
jgi:hypothetical protein